jgi:hypothetical protein
MYLNGIEITGPYEINMMTVYASGRLFVRSSVDSQWYLYEAYQLNFSSGPTASPVPVNITFSPSHPQISHLAPIGTHVADIAVTMSDGSAFSGTIAIDDTTDFAISGSSIITHASLSGPFFLPKVTATQNGVTFLRIIDVEVT